MLLDPPGMLPVHQLPHWPYLQAVDAALAGRGIPPGAVRISRSGRAHSELMTMRLYWDASRTGGPAGHGGLRLAQQEETGWKYALVGLAQDQVILAGQVDALHRIYAAPDDVAERMVRNWRRPAGDFHQEGEQAASTRAAIGAVRQPSQPTIPLTARSGRATAACRASRPRDL